MIIHPDCRSVQVRAERYGSGNGRVYFIEVETTDEAGNTGRATYEVHVPLNAKQQAVAGAVVYSVTGKCTTSTAKRDMVSAELGFEETILKVAVYPNPVNGSQLTIQFYSNMEQDADISFINATSQKVAGLQQPLKEGINQFMLSTENLPNGVYVIIIQKDHQQFCKKGVILK